MSPRRGRDLAGIEDRLAGLHGDDSLDGSFDTLLGARLRHLVPALPLRVGEEFGAALANLIGDSHVFRMVGNGNPVQRPVLFESHAIIHSHFPARRDLEEVIGAERYPKHPRVEGVAGVDVRDAPVDAVGETLVRVRRIIGLLLCNLAGRSSGRRSILPHGNLTEAIDHHSDCDGS